MAPSTSKLRDFPDSHAQCHPWLDTDCPQTPNVHHCPQIQMDGVPGSRTFQAESEMPYRIIVPAMDNDIPIRGRAAVPGRRGAWGHSPSLFASSAIIHGHHNNSAEHVLRGGMRNGIRNVLVKKARQPFGHERLSRRAVFVMDRGKGPRPRLQRPLGARSNRFL